MTEKPRPDIGVISDSPLQRHALQSVLNGYGLNIIVSCGPNLLENQQEDRVSLVDCWIIDLEDEETESPALEQLIDESESPILFGLGMAPAKNDEKYISWERRLLSKLEEQVGPVEQFDSEESIIALDSIAQDKAILKPKPNVALKRPSHQIWVLAASLGGPAAVKEFLDEIPYNIKAGFLYAQHIDSHFSKVLTNVLGRHSQLELKPASSGMSIHDGEVLMVPVEHEIVFSENGIEATEQDWDGPYGPSIDHLLRNLHDYYGARCHTIVFSGMGNDGSLTAPKMRRQGCHVWAQTPDSCANASMPQSIIDLNCSDRIGSPRELARAFIAQVGCHPEVPESNSGMKSQVSKFN